MEGVAASDILDVIEGYNDDGYGVIDGDLLGDLLLLCVCVSDTICIVHGVIV